MQEKDLTLSYLFKKRQDFMQNLKNEIPESYPQWPIDIKTKESQKFCRDIALKGVEEMFEALQHLKNWKNHRKTDVPDIDDEKFLEEIIDAFNYFISLLILLGIDEKKFIIAFNKKDKTINERIKNGY